MDLLNHFSDNNIFEDANSNNLIGFENNNNSNNNADNVPLHSPLVPPPPADPQTSELPPGLEFLNFPLYQPFNLQQLFNQKPRSSLDNLHISENNNLNSQPNNTHNAQLENPNPFITHNSVSHNLYPDPHPHTQNVNAPQTQIAGFSNESIIKESKGLNGRNESSASQNRKRKTSSSANQNKKVEEHIIADRARRARLSAAIEQLRGIIKDEGDNASIVQKSADLLHNILNNQQNLLNNQLIPINNNQNNLLNNSNINNLMNTSQSITTSLETTNINNKHALNKNKGKCSCAEASIIMDPLVCTIGGLLNADVMLMRVNQLNLITDVNVVFENTTGFHRSAVIGTFIADLPLHRSISLLPSPEYIAKCALRQSKSVNNNSVDNNHSYSHTTVDNDSDSYRDQVFDRTFEDLCELDPNSPTIMAYKSLIYDEHNHANHPHYQDGMSKHDKNRMKNDVPFKSLGYRYPVPFISTIVLKGRDQLTFSPRICAHFTSKKQLESVSYMALRFMHSLSKFFNSAPDSVPVLVRFHTAFGRDLEAQQNVRVNMDPSDGSVVDAIAWSFADSRRIVNDSKPCQGISLFAKKTYRELWKFKSEKQLDELVQIP